MTRSATLSAVTSAPLRNLTLLLAGVSLVVAPHALRLPLWLTAITLALIVWRGWAAARNERLPRKPILMVCVAVGIFAIFMHFRTLLGRDAGVAMLVMFLGLKLLETRHERDVVVVAFLAYFLVLANFFYTQSPWSAAHMTLATVILTAALVGFNAPREDWRHHFKVGTGLLAAGVPLAALLFVLFPRFDGPLWSLPGLGGEAVVGLSDTMSPGDITRLSQSDAIAFRARFEESPPPQRALYWRGPVLTDFDGRVWSPGGAADAGPYRLRGKSDVTRYEITLEPHERLWMFALELPAFIPQDARGSADYQLLARRPIRTRTRYQVASYLEYEAIGSGYSEQRAALALPDGFNPRAVTLAREWRQQLRSDAAIIERATEYFRAQGIAYTTNPPALGRHAVDEFLFETKQGFCEHFSAAFVVLMRAANVPARVVTGYQGGVVNPYDRQMIVRQADAHAWAEVWIEGTGWKRVDPTAAAAPARVERGLAAAVPDTDPLPFMLRPAIPLLAKLRQNLEAMTNYWNQWVLGYNAARQRQLLSSFGVPSASSTEIMRAMLIAVGVVLLGVVVLMLRERGPIDPAQRAWLRFCAKLSAAGTVRAPAEGPLMYAERASRDHPQLAASIADIAQLYIAVRYGDSIDGAAQARLDRAVRALHVAPRDWGPRALARRWLARSVTTPQIGSRIERP